MALIDQITALLDAKQERLIEKDSQRSLPESELNRTRTMPSNRT